MLFDAYASPGGPGGPAPRIEDLCELCGARRRSSTDPLSDGRGAAACSGLDPRLDFSEGFVSEEGSNVS